MSYSYTELDRESYLRAEIRRLEQLHYAETLDPTTPEQRVAWSTFERRDVEELENLILTLRQELARVRGEDPERLFRYLRTGEWDQQLDSGKSVAAEAERIGRENATKAAARFISPEREREIVAEINALVANMTDDNVAEIGAWDGRAYKIAESLYRNNGRLGPDGVKNAHALGVHITNWDGKPCQGGKCSSDSAASPWPASYYEEEPNEQPGEYEVWIKPIIGELQSGAVGSRRRIYNVKDPKAQCEEIGYALEDLLVRGNRYIVEVR